MALAILENETKGMRFDLRIEPSRKSAYERAAAINGQTVSQWTLANLDVAVERDIAAARTLHLTDEAFDQICDMLDKPVPEELQELIGKEPLWV